jgi:hypothetical protein
MTVSVQLKQPETEVPMSPQAKASDIIFNDGVDLQTKYDNAGLINPGALNGISAVSPTVHIEENTDETFRLKIKSIGETIVTPNLKGTDANATAVKVQEVANARGNIVVDISNGETIFMDITGDIGQLTFSGLENPEQAHYVTLLMKHSKAYRMYCGGNIKWPYDNKNKFYRLNEGINCVRLMTIDGGNSWYVISVIDYLDEE